MGYNSINQAASLELIAAMKGKSMVSIGMARCELGVEGAKAMAELVLVTASLTSLLLGDNNFGDDGAEALSVGLKDSKRLATLNLSNTRLPSTKFGPKGAAALASAIAAMAPLTSVR